MSQIQQVKEATNIIEILGEKITLQRAGTYWRALCPFHGEKSPSFFVSEQFQRYKCFGCGEHGDVFTFLQKYDGLTFGEAIQLLADRAGIKLESFRPDPAEEQRKKMLEILDLAKEYYCYLLTEHEAGEPGRAYLRERGVTAESIKVFQLGYALPAWDGLIAYLHGKKGYALEDLDAAGLIAAGRNGNPYDRFRGRLMFPLKNHRGQVVGFSGRVLEKDVKEAKYINSPETLLYHKSQMLFGYSELYQFLRQSKSAVVVEGEFDVISSAQAHVNNVVAIKGSALTADHLRLLGRVVEQVIFSLDVDDAGIKATKRAIELSADLPLEIRVVRVPSGKDPDEMARLDPAGWRDAVKASVSVYEFLLQAALQQYDATSPEGKRKIVTEMAPVLTSISHAVEQEVYVRKLAAALGTKEETLRQDMRTFGNRPTRKSVPVRRTEKPENSETKHTPVSKLDPKRAKAEQFVLFLLFNQPAAQWPKLAKDVSMFVWHTPAVTGVITSLMQARDANQWLANLDEDIRECVFDWQSQRGIMMPEGDDEWQREWQHAQATLEQLSTHDQLQQIQTELGELDRLAELTPEQQAKQEELLRKIVQLRQQRSL